ncbi:MAG: hypothetical protein M3N98_09680, partial [Actinomycetota bacterium]|nr:hypothetical protein [Actinomycetota bacterium]
MPDVFSKCKSSVQSMSLSSTTNFGTYRKRAAWLAASLFLMVAILTAFGLSSGRPFWLTSSSGGCSQCQSFEIASQTRQETRSRPSLVAVAASSVPAFLVVAAETEPALSAGGDSAATQARGGVYSLQDEAGDVVRTGRTNDL